MINKNTIRVPLLNNHLLKKVVEKVNQDKKLINFWNIINFKAINRWCLTDHGPTHFQIVANTGLRILRLLTKKGVKMSVAEDYGLTENHSELIVFLASIFHDLGMIIDIDEHEKYSVLLCYQFLDQYLDFLNLNEKNIIIVETLYAILHHQNDKIPKTKEAGILKIADGLDISEGRSRIPYQKGIINTLSISAQAIKNITIKEGEKRPVKIEILMTNSSGIFQIDYLLKERVKKSGIAQFFELKAYIKRKEEKKLITEYTIENFND